jgi:membrane protease YdiL (CAAX protease family)
VSADISKERDQYFGNFMTQHQRLFLVIWVSGILSVLAVLPYAFDLQSGLLQNNPFSLPVLALLSLVQTAILLAIATYFGLKMAKNVGFQFPILEPLLSRRGNSGILKGFLWVPIILGFATAVVIALLNWLFTIAGVVIDAEYSIGIPLWKRILASFYGGIAEEILLRLFFMTLLVWIFSKIIRSKQPLAKRNLVWAAIVIAAIVFGLGHLPATAAIIGLTPLVIARALLLNGVAGLVLGWLYWKRGLEAASVAHFTADIMILVVLPFLVG